VVEQGDHLVRIAVDAIGRRVGRLVAAPVAEQVEQNDAVALLGESLGDAAVEFCVQQQAVKVDDQGSARRAVDVINEPVAVVAEGEVKLNRDDAH
jgi:hypothetical protein